MRKRWGCGGEGRLANKSELVAHCFLDIHAPFPARNGKNKRTLDIVFKLFSHCLISLSNFSLLTQTTFHAVYMYVYVCMCVYM